MGESGGVADDDPDSGAAIAARREFLDPTIIEERGRIAAVFGEDLGKFTSGTKCLAKNTFEYRLLDHSRPFRWSTCPVGLAGSTVSDVAYR